MLEHQIVIFDSNGASAEQPAIVNIRPAEDQAVFAYFIVRIAAGPTESCAHVEVLNHGELMFASSAVATWNLDGVLAYCDATVRLVCTQPAELTTFAVYTIQMKVRASFVLCNAWAWLRLQSQSFKLLA